MGRIHEALGGFVGPKTSNALRKDVEKIAAEVQLLQSLVDQLRGARQPALRAETLPVPAAAEPPDQTAIVVRGGDQDAHGLDDTAILQIIQDGLSRDRVELALQPIVSLPQRKHRFFEAFTRIRADDGSFIVPDQYIGIAEREGLITAIDNMLLFRCVQLLRKMQGKIRNVGFFCNISPHTLADQKFFAIITLTHVSVSP